MSREEAFLNLCTAKANMPTPAATPMKATIGIEPECDGAVAETGEVSAANNREFATGVGTGVGTKMVGWFVTGVGTGVGIKMVG
jgi:hypothetical protein